MQNITSSICDGGVPAAACLAPGQHVGHIHQNAEEHLAVLAMQMAEALKRRERILRVMDDSETAEGLLRALQGRVEGLPEAVKSGGLVLLPWRDCAASEGAFDTTKLIQLLAQEARSALKAGYTALRFLLEMPAAPGVLEARSLVVFETNLSQLMEGSAMLGLCQFNRRQFSAEFLLTVLRTHRQVIVGTELYDNFYFVTPGQLLKGYMPDAEFSHYLDNLVTYRKALVALKESGQFNEDIISNAMEGIVVYDDQLRYIVWNRFMEQLTGLPREAVVGRRVMDVFPFVVNQGVDVHLRRALSGETVHTPDISFSIESTGKQGWVSLCYAPHRDANGTIVGVIGIVHDVADRHESEEELKASEEKYRTFVQNFQGIAFRSGLDFAPIFFHGSVESITGYTEDDFLSAEPRWEQIVYPDDLRNMREGVDNLRTIPSYSTEREYRIVRRDGQIRWIREHIQNICDEFGTPRFVQGTLYDITARKRIERALRDSETKYRRIVELSFEGIWALDTELRTTFVNKRMADMLGYHVGEMIGRHATDFVFQEDRKDYEARLAEHKVGGMYEARFRRRDGAALWTRVSATPLHDETERYLGAFAMFTDISDRHAMEEALRSSEASLAAFIDALPEDAFLVDVNGIVYLANEVAARRKQVGREELHGRSIYDLVTPALADLFKRYVREAAETGNRVRFEESQSGRCIVHEFCPILVHGQAMRIALFAFDISAQKRAEEDMRVAREKADAANRAKSDFLANMSHEVRNPMNGLLGLLDMLQTSRLDGEQRRCLDMAKSSADTLLAIIDDILDFSRIEEGRMEFVAREFELRQEIESALQPFVFGAQNKGLDLKWSIDDSVPERVVSDPVRLRQVLLNLVSNGIKYTPMGGVTVHVGLEEAGTPDAGKARGRRKLPAGAKQAEALSAPADSVQRISLHLVVSDTGMGMSEEKLTHIFDPFYQAGIAASGKHAGTGLGLSISRRLTELMGGRIWAESVEGEGSRFHFVVPVARGQKLSVPEMPPGKAVPDQGKSGKGKDAAVAGPKRKLTILVAEDDPTSRHLVELLLQRDGNRVIAVENGEQAVQQCGKENIDLVLMDVQMPVMDGLEAARQIRKEEGTSARRHIPILAVTAYAIKGDRERILAAGMDEYIAKPIDAAKLRSTVDRMVANGHHTN